ncbi:MAG TPA: hypothetical protein VKG86_02180 [Terracidiphilus sp.]|nr:hypothetical protein [Terracidiphilus sp.]
MLAPLRGTQTLVGQMGWVFARPSLTAIEVGWRWIFGIPFLAVCWMQVRQILTVLPPQAAGLTGIDPQNPWVAAVQLANAWALYQPHVMEVLRWLLPLAALAWVVISTLGRSLVLKRLDPSLRFRPLEMILLQAAWLALFAVTCWGWFRSIAWVAATHITPAGEPDLVGYSIWAIFLSLGFFTAWALLSWALSIAPLLMLLEERSALSSLGQSLRLGKNFTGKLVEINLVMGIVKLALMVLAMVLSAAPLPFSDQLGPDALHVLWLAATVFYLVASDYFHVVRLKGFQEFWKMFRGQQAGEVES